MNEKQQPLGHLGKNILMTPHCVFAGAVCLVLTFLVYWPAINATFFVFDDSVHIYGNVHFKSLGFQEFVLFWTNSYESLYIPITYSLWSVVAGLFGVESPVPYHVLNLVFHAFNSWLVFIWLTQLLNCLPQRNKALQHRNSIPWIALTGSVLFNVHPIHVEAVAWVSSFKDLNSTAWALCALIFHFAYRSTTSKRKAKQYKYIAFGFIVLGVLAKSNISVLVVLLAWLDRVVFRLKFRELIVDNALLCVPSILIAYISVQLQPSSYLHQLPSFAERMIISVDALRLYAVNILNPVALSFDYERSVSNVLNEWNSELSYKLMLLFTIGLICLSYIGRIRRLFSVETLGLSIGLILILPNLGVITYVFQNISTVADRYFYLPFLGVSVFFCGLMLRLDERLESRPSKNKQRYFWCVPVLLLLIYSGMSFLQAKTWRTSSSQIRHSLKANPESYPLHMSFATALKAELQWADSIRVYKKARKLKPEYGEPVHGIVEGILSLGGDVTHAVRYYEKALSQGVEINPFYFKQVGYYFVAQKDIKQAQHYFWLAQKLEPDSKEIAEQIRRLEKLK
ncbi:MAG: hypothetical protein HN576_01225 [Bacteriovoracaceae bacterium]|nr:hypothetical protein [Bacteriovoracaceae bacterium]